MSRPVDVRKVLNSRVQHALANARVRHGRPAPRTVTELQDTEEAVRDLIEAVSKLRVHTYLVTDPDLRELFGGQRRIAVVNMETLEALRDALVTCKGCMP